MTPTNSELELASEIVRVLVKEGLLRPSDRVVPRVKKLSSLVLETITKFNRQTVEEEETTG